MAASRVGTALRQLTGLFQGRRAGARTDGQLLDRFVREQDEAAFAALVQRHGCLVLGVCRRVLGNTHDAEDAFQASFLVLLRNAAAIRRRESLAGWLHGVAHRTALKARTAAARRRCHEQQAAREPRSVAAAEPTWDDLRPVLDQELRRLPEHYRAPLILCYLEGRSKEEAAQELRCPTGTISSRLARARGFLRQRLARRGVTLSLLALVALLEQGTAIADVPDGLALATLANALRMVQGQGVNVSAAILSLTKGVQQAMFLSKLKIIVLFSALPLLLLAGGMLSYGLLAKEKPSSAPAAEDKGLGKDAAPKLTDEQALQGTWRQVIKSDATGRVVYERMYIFKGDKYWSVSGNNESGPRTYRLDAAKSPKEIDFQLQQPIPRDLGTVATMYPCIYELAGDTLRIVSPGQDLRRPTSLDDAQVFTRVGGGRIKKIIEQKRDAAAEEAALRLRECEAGRGPTDLLLDANRRWVSAERELAAAPEERYKALTAYLERLRKLEALVKVRVEIGKVSGIDLANVRYYRLEAEQWVEEAKEK